MTVADLLADALREIRVLNAVDAAGPEDAALALFRLNKIFDNQNADRRGVYADLISTFTITPSLNPHTIGPTASSPTWTLTQRPEEIRAANLIISNQRTPLALHPNEWRMGLSDPTLTSAIPTDLAYDLAWPLGKIYFYPVPSSAYTVELLTRVVLASVASSDTFTLPPGYQDALTLTLAEDLIGPFNVPLPQTLPVRAAKARARVWSAHAKTPALVTRDAGLPGGSSESRRTYYDHLSRDVR